MRRASGTWIQAARCAGCVSKKHRISSLTTATKRLCIFLNNRRRPRKPPPRCGPWKFALHSQSEMMGEHLRRCRITATRIAMTEATATATPAVAPPRYTRANPFPARMVVNRGLSGPESEKDTRHFELDLTGWGLSFEVGDSLAVYPTNDPQLVDEIIHALGLTGHEEVHRPRGESTSLREALLRDYSITRPTP